MKRKHYRFILLAGLVAGLVILSSEPVWGHDCYARLMNGDFSGSDCANTVWDQMAPIFAALAVALAIALAVVGGAVIVGIGTAVGGSTLLQGVGYAVAAYGAYSTYQTYQKEGWIGVVKEESGYNDFAEALNPDNSLGETIGYAGMGYVKLITTLLGVGQGWKGLKQGLKQGWKDLSEGLKDIRKGGIVEDWLTGRPQGGFTVTMAGPPIGGRPGGRPRSNPPKASKKSPASKTSPKDSKKSSTPKTTTKSSKGTPSKKQTPSGKGSPGSSSSGSSPPTPPDGNSPSPPETPDPSNSGPNNIRGNTYWPVHPACPSYVHPELPVRDYGDSTKGIFEIDDSSNKAIRLESSWPGSPDANYNIPNLSDNAKTVLSHVEGHAAAIMRTNNIPAATLYINYIDGPCRFCLGESGKSLNTGIQEILLPGQILHVNYPLYPLKNGGIGRGYFVGGEDGGFVDLLPDF